MVNPFVNPFNLSGKQILVTGASSGIGKAISVACAGMGATLYLNPLMRSLTIGINITVLFL